MRLCLLCFCPLVLQYCNMFHHRFSPRIRSFQHIVSLFMPQVICFCVLNSFRCETEKRFLVATPFTASRQTHKDAFSVFVWRFCVCVFWWKQAETLQTQDQMFFFPYSSFGSVSCLFCCRSRRCCCLVMATWKITQWYSRMLLQVENMERVALWIWCQRKRPYYFGAGKCWSHTLRWSSLTSPTHGHPVPLSSLSCTDSTRKLWISLTTTQTMPTPICSWPSLWQKDISAWDPFWSQKISWWAESPMRNVSSPMLHPCISLYLTPLPTCNKVSFKTSVIL